MQKLTLKLIKILGEIDALKKEGHNENQGYAYFSEAQLAAILRKKFAENNLFVFTDSHIERIEHVEETIKNERKTNHFVSVVTKHEIVDQESGEHKTVVSCGQGVDRGDKAIYKAITGSFKYFMMKNFFISDFQDPENEKDKDDANKLSDEEITYKEMLRQKESEEQAKAMPTATKELQVPNVTPDKYELMKIVNVVKKEGVTKGKPWVRYGALVQPEQGKEFWANTFDLTNGEKALQLKGQEVYVVIHESDKGVDLLDIKTEEEMNDNAPF